MPAPTDRIGPTPEPPRGGTTPDKPKPAKRRAGPLRWLGRLVGLVAGVAFLAVLGGGAVAWHEYNKYHGRPAQRRRAAPCISRG